MQLEQQTRQYVPLLERVLDSAQSRYLFIHESSFKELVEREHYSHSNKIYVQEILYYFHAAALVTIRRNLSWIRALDVARESGAFFSFCSSLRGLIESAADSFYSLRYAPQNLARYSSVLCSCLQGKEEEQQHNFKKLEDWGIHFLAAGKYEDPNLPKEHYKARPTWEYIKAIDVDGEIKCVYPLYERLCQFTHPSRETAYLFFREQGHEWSVRAVDERALIHELENGYDQEYDEILQKSFNTALIVIWLIDRFGVEGLDCPEIRLINLEDIGEFRKVLRLLSESG